jgi:hypothetical protein
VAEGVVEGWHRAPTRARRLRRALAAFLTRRRPRVSIRKEGESAPLLFVPVRAADHGHGRSGNLC